MQIGYIGLGLMGAPCAGHLLKAGHTVHIWARRREKVLPLLERGMLWHDSPAEVAASVEVLFTNLTDTPDVRAVLLGENGVVEGGKHGLIVADMSTVSATASREFAARLKERGIDFADTPVSGGTAGAQAATLTIMAGADEAVFEKLRPLLSVMGSKVTRIGGVGSGQVAKSCNQIVITVSLLAVSEAFKFCERLEVDPAKVREALLGGFAGSKILEMHALRMLENNYAPGFKTRLHVKDMNIVNGLAEELNIRLPASALGLDALRDALRAGYGEEDSSAVFKVINK
jgi:2-hydroxy-3-oxopropionate reductase